MSKKFLANLLLIIVVVISGFLVSAPAGYAQTDQVWSEPVNLSNSGSSTDPILVIDASGTLHVIWVDQFDGYKYVQSSDGISWTQPQTVNFPFSARDDSRPVLVPNNTDNSIYVFWKDAENSLYYRRAPVRSFGAPTSWGETVKLADAVLDFVAIVDTNGTLHVSYAKSTDQNDSPAGVYYRKLDGAGWSATQNLYISQYFRSLTLENSHVRLAVTSNDVGSKTVYVAWDDRLQKRIFLTKSTDGGATWGEFDQIMGPEDFTGSDLPFNIEVSTINQNLLMLWQVGEPGNRCTQFSQVSTDGGIEFSEPVKMLGELVSCPNQINFISSKDDYSIALLNIQDDPSLIAWDGSRWSTSQNQVELSVFSNPKTLDNVLLGCQRSAVYNDILYTVGCDKGKGEDIWFRSRALGALDAWFPPPSAWTSPSVVATVRQKISSLVAISDDRNSLHAFWVQAPLFGVESTNLSIQYSRWVDRKWSKPGGIISGFEGVPVNLSAFADVQGRLFLLWNVGTNGDLYFSWASADRAQNASEWSVPVQVPTPTQISGSSDFLVDDSGRIVVVYSVPVNENRGIYIVQSNDLGKTWSQPKLVFDAVATGWGMADQSKITLSGDGRLHLLFSNSSLRDADQAGGLYYIQSSDGGSTWSEPTIVAEKLVLWDDIAGFGGQTVHLFWQENNGVSMDVLHQISYDGGETWERSTRVFTGGDMFALVALSKGLSGQLFLAQTHAEGSNLFVDVSSWSNARWVSMEKKEFSVKGEGSQFTSAMSVLPQGQLHVMTSIVYPELLDGLQNEIVSFSRTLELPIENQLPMNYLVAAGREIPAVSSPEIQLTPTDTSPLANLGSPPSSSRKNLVGLLMVGGVMILLILIVWPWKRRSDN